MAVLSHQDDRAWIRHRDQDDGGGMPYDLEVALEAVGEPHSLHRDIEDAPLEHGAC
jgi:hypothetical protein